MIYGIIHNTRMIKKKKIPITIVKNEKRAITMILQAFKEDN